MSSSSCEAERTFSKMSFDLESGKSSQKASHTGMVNQRANARLFKEGLKAVQKEEEIAHKE